jgi:hypothetical protein
VSKHSEIAERQADREQRIERNISPVDLKEGFGWRIASPAFVERWRREEDELTARGYRVLSNRFGDLLVSYWPAEKQAVDAAEPHFTETVDLETGEIIRTSALAGNGPHGRGREKMQRRRERKARRAARRSGSSANTVIIPGAGRPCPRCQRPMQIREHKEIGEQELRRPNYFRRWYRCVHADCKTTMMSFEEDRVYPAVAPPIAPVDPWKEDIALVDPDKLTAAPWE